VLKLAQLRSKTAETNEATILARHGVLGLASREELQQARQVLVQADEHLAALWTVDQPSAVAADAPAVSRQAALSSWLLTALCVQTLRVVVQGYWTPARLRASPNCTALSATVRACGPTRRAPSAPASRPT
jgi:hypothetical protein